MLRYVFIISSWDDDFFGFCETKYLTPIYEPDYAELQVHVPKAKVLDVLAQLLTSNACFELHAYDKRPAKD